MNRNRLSVSKVGQAAKVPEFSAESGLFASASLDTTYALFAPLHYERAYPYPLIVWLHGGKSDERQLMRIMPLVSMRNYIAAAPRGLLVETSEDKSQYIWQQDEQHVQQAQQRVFDCIEAVQQRLHIARHRVFLAGFDCGGTMAFRVAMQHPEQFAGVLSLGGGFPQGRTPLAHLKDTRNLPVFLAAGRDSSVYPPERVCEDLRLLHAAGLSLTVRQYPCGQELSPQMLADVDRWIMEQIVSPGVASVASNQP